MCADPFPHTRVPPFEPAFPLSPPLFRSWRTATSGASLCAGQRSRRPRTGRLSHTTRDVLLPRASPRAGVPASAERGPDQVRAAEVRRAGAPALARQGPPRRARERGPGRHHRSPPQQGRSVRSMGRRKTPRGTPVGALRPRFAPLRVPTRRPPGVVECTIRSVPCRHPDPDARSRTRPRRLTPQSPTPLSLSRRRPSSEVLQASLHRPRAFPPPLGVRVRFSGLRASRPRSVPSHAVHSSRARRRRRGGRRALPRRLRSLRYARSRRRHPRGFHARAQGYPPGASLRATTPRGGGGLRGVRLRTRR